MNAEQVLKSINRIAGLYEPSIAKTPEFEALAQSLREEIALAEQKKSGKVDRFKAALRFSKKCRKELEDIHPGISGAYIDDKGRQFITNRYLAVRYEKPFDGLVEAENGERPNIDSLLSNYDRSRSFTLPELGHLKTMFKLDKAEGKLVDGLSNTYIDGVRFNTEYLIQIMEMVEPTEAYLSNSSKHAALIVIGEGATGIVLPMRSLR